MAAFAGVAEVQAALARALNAMPAPPPAKRTLAECAALVAKHLIAEHELGAPLPKPAAKRPEIPMEELGALLAKILNSVRGRSGWSMRAVADALLLAAAEPPLSAVHLAEAIERYSTAAVLRALLTHDPVRDGVPIKLLSARWLLTHFQANTSARLEHRQHLERNTPEAFVTGAMLERVLAELVPGESPYNPNTSPYNPNTRHGGPIKECVYMTELDGEYVRVTDGTFICDPVPIAFPSAVAMSHMWLDPHHPDPDAKNLREIWLPALEWFYSERVRQLTYCFCDEARVKDAYGTPLSDEAVLEAADFAIFIE